MDKINKDFFSEFHPNPIIGLDLSYEIIYLNLSARTQFPSIVSAGIKHPVLSILVKEFKKLKPNGKDLFVFSQNIRYFENIYEQQIFLMPNNDIIFIFMNEVTEKVPVNEPD